jgi:hypothetical protein
MSLLRVGSCAGVRKREVAGTDAERVVVEAAAAAAAAVAFIVEGLRKAVGRLKEVTVVNSRMNVSRLVFIALSARRDGGGG